MRATPKVIPSVLTCLPTASEADGGGVAVVWTFCCCYATEAVEGQSDRRASDMEV